MSTPSSEIQEKSLLNMARSYPVDGDDDVDGMFVKRLISQFKKRLSGSVQSQADLEEFSSLLVILLQGSKKEGPASSTSSTSVVAAADEPQQPLSLPSTDEPAGSLDEACHQ